VNDPKQLLGIKGASETSSIWKLRIQLMKPITWIPLIWGVICGAAASGNFEWTFSNVLASLACMLMSGPLLAGYTHTINDFLDKEIVNKVKEKIKSELLNHKPTNALVHGDLWSGNAGIDKKGRGVIFDPASWWADNEVDIAMTRLFGGFGNEFYEEYHKIFPIIEGFEKRIIIYNFYHILNHANMFGGGYFNQAKDYVKAILNM